ncbi:MAG: DUF374 domain-containing protein [Planctomycetaceae bacterium]|jgi:lysophospholipid acyltransferase (LPLAT)-like uncharacterized protein|nr:DUF374 domain-containing protein [Planctomycetaceae bacterium]
MKFSHPLFFKIGGVIAAPLIRCWLGTLDMKLSYPPGILDPAYGWDGQSRLYLFWHEYIFYPLAIRGHSKLTMLLSQHTDANIVQELSDRFGFKCVRGSTNRGGLKAIREMRDLVSRENLTIAADGPQGPRRGMALGPIYIASRLRLPIILIGFGYQNGWRVNSWDKFAIPRPYSRVRGILSRELFVPENANRDTLEQYRISTQQALTKTTIAAEEWANSEQQMENEVAVEPDAKSSMFYGEFPNHIFVQRKTT